MPSDTFRRCRSVRCKRGHTGSKPTNSGALRRQDSFRRTRDGTVMWQAVPASRMLMPRRSTFSTLFEEYLTQSGANFSPDFRTRLHSHCGWNSCSTSKGRLRARFQRVGKEVRRFQASRLDRIERSRSVTQRLGDRASALYCQPGTLARSIKFPRSPSPRILRTSELCGALSQCLARRMLGTPAFIRGMASGR